MTDIQRARLTMFQATLAVLEQYAELYLKNTALIAARTQLAGYVADLDPTAARQQDATAGRPGAVKKQTRVALAQRAAEVAAALSALADETNDVALFTDADYTERQLRRQTDNDLLRLTQKIHQQATDRLPALAAQDVTAEELAALQQAIAAFRAEQAAPRTVVATAKATNVEIAADVRDAGALLSKRVDKYLLRYRRPQPAFYTAYESARQTINSAARSTGSANPAQ